MSDLHGRLATYAAEGLGLSRSELRLEPQRDRWRRIYSQEAHILFDQLRVESLRLYHCGSTSVPKIAAKPVIDVLAGVNSLGELEARRSALEAVGYEWRGEFGIPGRRFCTLSDPATGRAFIHVHFFEHPHEQMERHLVFRDYLRAHPEAARAYEVEKRRLIEGERVSRAEYSDAKNAWIDALLVEARRWRSPPKKIVALLGSAAGGGETRKFLLERYPQAEVVDLASLNLAPYAYASSGPNAGGGSPGDALAALVKQMQAADLIVFATPVYWYAMSGSMKDFFDRLSDLLRGPLKPLGDAFYGKRICLLATGSDPRLPFGFEVPVHCTAVYFGMDYEGAQYRSVGP